MPQRFEGHFKGSDQTELFFQTWNPDKDPARGIFVITHGLAEHSECYATLAKILAEDGWQVYAWDMRGHGRSEGKRGYVKNLSYYVDDLEVFFQMITKEAQGKNIVLFGHSMGGLVTLRYLQSKRVKYAALVLSSPLLGLKLQVPKLKEAAARLAVKWLPTLTMYNEVKYEDLTRDEEMRQAYAKDNLRHDKISPGLFLSMLDNFPLAMQNATEIQSPVLMQIAGEDKIVSPDAERQFYDKLTGKKQVEIYPDSYHESYNDLDRDKVIADLKKFIHPYLGA